MGREHIVAACFIVNGDALPKASRDNIIVAPASGQLNLSLYVERSEPPLA